MLRRTPTAVMVAALAIWVASRVTSPSARTVHSEPRAGSLIEPDRESTTTTTTPSPPKRASRAITTIGFLRTRAPSLSPTSVVNERAQPGSLDRGGRNPACRALLPERRDTLPPLGRAEVAGRLHGQVGQVGPD